MSDSLSLDTIVEREHPQMPRFLVLPNTALESWGLTGTTVVECSLNGIEIGRRTLKRWDAERWFIDLPERLCLKVEIDKGDSVELTCRIASTHLPKELQLLIEKEPAAKSTWDGLTESQQRMLREHVAAAKQSLTRERRAVRALILPRPGSA